MVGNLTEIGGKAGRVVGDSVAGHIRTAGCLHFLLLI